MQPPLLLTEAPSADAPDTFDEPVPGAWLRYRIDPDGRHHIAHFNAACCELWEIDPQAFADDVQAIWRMVDPSDLLDIRRASRQAAQTRSDWCYRCFITTPSGRRKSLHGVGRPSVGSDGAVEWTTLTLDTTAPDAALTHAREGEHRFLRLLDALPHLAVQGCSSDLTVKFWNRRSTELYGYSAGEAIGRNLLELIVPPDMHAAVAAAANRMIETGQPMAGADVVLRRKDGSPVPVHSGWIYLERSGAEAGFYRIDLDLSERQGLHERWAALESHLRESQKMESLGTLAGGVAHDFNNIVAAILGNVDIALADLPPGTPAHVSLLEIGKAGARARDLVRQILAFSRRQPIDRKVIDLADVVHETSLLLRATLPAGVRLQVDRAPQLPPVLADATQIEQVLLNLCTNAWQALRGTPEDALHISLQPHTGAPPVQGFGGPDFVPVGDWPPVCVRLCVTDNGSGMDEATQQRMFEPFFTTKPPGQGTGLGLSVVHGILRDHHAVMTVDSAPGQGTTIAIYLPAASSAPVRNEPPPPPAAAPSSLNGQAAPTHIVYVDDDDLMVTMMRRLLQRNGYRVSAYSDAREAIGAVQDPTQSIDLVITDFNMPGMSGLQLATTLRRLRPDLPVAIASGYIDDDLQTRAPLAGVTELLYKPDGLQAMVAAIERLMQRVGSHKPQRTQ